MFKYRATLHSGAVVTRKSDRIYTHYWRVVGINNSAGGFAGSEAALLSKWLRDRDRAG